MIIHYYIHIIIWMDYGMSIWIIIIIHINHIILLWIEYIPWLISTFWLSWDDDMFISKNPMGDMLKRIRHPTKKNTRIGWSIVNHTSNENWMVFLNTKFISHHQDLLYMGVSENAVYPPNCHFIEIFTKKKKHMLGCVPLNFQTKAMGMSQNEVPQSKS